VANEYMTHAGVDSGRINDSLYVDTQVMGTATLRLNPYYVPSNHCAGTYGAP